MTTPTTTLDAIGGSSVEEIAALTRTGSTPHVVEHGKHYIVVHADGDITNLDLTGDSFRPYPARIRQTVHLTHVDSLLDFWTKHSDSSSEVYADRDRRTITTVLDAHHGTADADGDARPRWQTHRAILTLTIHDAMKAWLDGDGQMRGQVAFAEFLEDNLPYITDPLAADLLEMVQDVQATVQASFKSGYKISNGARQFQWTEQVDSTTKGGTLEVPTTFALRLPVWRGATTSEEMTARLRVRPGAAGLQLGYKLDRPTEVIDGAFEAVVEQVVAHVGDNRPVLRGTPAGA